MAKKYQIVINGASNGTKLGAETITPRVIFSFLFIIVIAIALVLTPTPKISQGAGVARAGFNPVASLEFKPGTTVGGFPCGPGKRQIPVSHYSPYCIPAWHGNNGGATSRGVTSTTITIDYREAKTSDLQVAYLVVPENVIGTNEEAIATMQAYVNYFNKVFELYGRHVVLKTFTGVSDFIQEQLGGDTQKVETDAANVANNVKSFADISLIDSSSIYDEYLSKDHVINFNLGFLPNSFYKQNAPYSYTTGPTCDQTAEGDAGLLARAIAGKPDAFAGDPAFQNQPAKIAIITPSGGVSSECTQREVNILTNVFHVQIATEVQYSLNLSTLFSDAANIVAQVKNSGANVVMCTACDPVSPSLALKAAQTANYYPFWLAEAAGAMSGGIDAFGQSIQQKFAPREIVHAVLATEQSVPRDSLQNEAWQAFLKGGGNPNNVEPLYPLLYEQLFLFFSALQQAGPDLTPTTFEEGFFSLPPSTPGGQFGNWKFGSGVFDPQASFQLGWYDPQAISPVNQQPGEWIACNNGLQINYSGYASNLKGVTLNCFGKQN